MLTISQAYGHKLSCFLVNIFLTILLGLCNELLEKPRCPAEKLMVGFGAYASTFPLTNPANCGLDAPTSGLGAARAYTQEAGSLGYFEVMSQRAGRTKEIDCLP